MRCAARSASPRPQVTVQESASAPPRQSCRDLAALKLNSHYSGDDDPVFASKNGKPLGHRNVTRRGSEPAIKLAGIGDVSIHDLRHAFASRMISRGVEPVTLASLMGHEDARITLSRYAHVYDKERTDDAVRAAMSR